eukprot:CAMPEP_0194037252 /NCGR_PEP_ID=MMETSP0009_2-20130614/9583_1 /TAXON_ID=210454 /ORGANISM="Grammatophora oceanica, Strain CCMP 410" /LENGTH=42 /DNA_ID= /DNA_START= /DNA_END= /DNA_ORIENTATION=
MVSSGSRAELLRIRCHHTDHGNTNSRNPSMEKKKKSTGWCQV